MKFHSGIGSLVLIGAVLTLSGCGAASSGSETTVRAAAPEQVPIYEWDPSWPKQPYPNKNWVTGAVGAVTVDSQDHIWMVHRLTDPAKLGAQYPIEESECCLQAPAVLEFDLAGNVVQGWGGPGPEYKWPPFGSGPPRSNQPQSTQRPRFEGPPREYHWPSSAHGLFVDEQKGHVWVGGGSTVLKFTRDGKWLGLEIGYDPTGTARINDSKNTRVLRTPTGIFVDSKANEVFIADGYGNRRVIVYDSNTGAFKRQWGAYGKPPDDLVPLRILPFQWKPTDPPHTAFTVVHCLREDKDGLLYVCDRGNQRIQVFKRDGTFIKETFIRPTTNVGSTYDIAFSRDPEQQFMFVVDGRNEKVWILRRADLQVIGEFGHTGRNGGGLILAHAIGIDSKNNLYIGESEGMRVQRFLYKGLGPQTRQYDKYGIALN